MAADRAAEPDGGAILEEGSTPVAGQDQGDRQFVTALSRGLDILASYGPDDRYLSNQEISHRTGLARPTVSRLTYTLTRTGHLRRNDATGEYRLGPNVLNLGFNALAGINIADRGGEVLDALISGPNPYVTVAIAERSGTRAVYLATRRQRQAMSLSIEIGAKLPLFYSGIGRAILVGLSAAKRAELLERGIAEFPEQKDRMVHSLREAVRDYNTRGYCTSFGGWKPEINAIAAPVRSLDGSSVYGLNIGGPSFLVSPGELHEKYGERLLQAVRDLDGS